MQIERAVCYYSVHYTDANGEDCMKRFYEDEKAAKQFSQKVHGKIKMYFQGWVSVYNHKTQIN